MIPTSPVILHIYIYIRMVYYIMISVYASTCSAYACNIMWSPLTGVYVDVETWVGRYERVPDERVVAGVAVRGRYGAERCTRRPVLLYVELVVLLVEHGVVVVDVGHGHHYDHGSGQGSRWPVVRGHHRQLVRVLCLPVQRALDVHPSGVGVHVQRPIAIATGHSVCDPSVVTAVAV